MPLINELVMESRKYANNSNAVLLYYIIVINVFKDYISMYLQFCQLTDYLNLDLVHSSF